MTKFGKLTFGDLTFGQMTFSDLTFGQMPFGDLTFGEVAFGDLTFGGELTFGKPTGHQYYYSIPVFKCKREVNE